MCVLLHVCVGGRCCVCVHVGVACVFEDAGVSVGVHLVYIHVFLFIYCMSMSLCSLLQCL